MRSNGLIVFIPKYGIEGTVVLTPKDSAMSDSEWIMNEDKQVVTARQGQEAFTVFDKIAVKISIVVGAAYRRQLSLEWIDRKHLPDSELMA